MNDVDKVIALIYEAAVEPATFIGMLAQLNQWLGSSFFHYLGYNGQSFSSDYSYISIPEFDSAAELYSQHYGLADPRRIFVNQHAPGTLMLCSDLLCNAEVDRLEVYQDFLICQGIRYTMGACLQRTGTCDTYLVFNKMHGQPTFSELEKTRFRLVMPHLIHCLTLIQKNSTLRLSALAGEHALQSMSMGIVTLSFNDKVIFKNEIIESWHKEGVCQLTEGQLRFAPLAAQQKFQSAIRQVRSTRIPLSLQLLCMHQGMPLRLLVQIAPAMSQSSSQTLHALDSLAPGRSSWLALESAGHFGVAADLVVQLSALTLGAVQTEQQLVQLFSLTKAECRLANNVSLGRSLSEYALQQGLSMATVRTQMRSLLQKTETSRQQELIRLLCQIPAQNTTWI